MKFLYKQDGTSPKIFLHTAWACSILLIYKINVPGKNKSF